MDVLKFHDFYRFFMPYPNPDCDDRVRLSKSDKNIGAGGWRVDTLFEAADSGDALAHPRITSGEISKASWVGSASDSNQDIIYVLA